MESIYVRLLNEGTEVWKPYKGEQISSKVYRLISEQELDENNVKPEFKPGDIVRVEIKKFSDGQFLTAFALYF